MKPASPSSAVPTWEEVAEAIRSYCRNRYGADPLRVVFDLGNGRSHRLPMPTLDAPSQPLTIAPDTQKRSEASEKPTQPLALATVPITRILETQHTEDFAIVVWQGVRYSLTPKQALVVRALWQAYQDGQPDVSQNDLLRVCNSDGVRLVDLFRRSPTWQNLVVSVKQGYYRLAGAEIELATDDAG